MTFKIASLVLDFYDDASFTVARQLPAEVHAATPTEASKVASLPDHLFGAVMKTAAGSLQRRWPLKTAEDVKLSRAYFDQARSLLPQAVAEQVAGKIARAEAGDTTGVAFIDLSKVAMVQQSDLQPIDESWGLVVGDRHYFPLHTPDQVKTAVSRFRFMTDGMELGHQARLAANIAKRASALGIPVPSGSSINWYSGDGLNAESLALALQQRKTAACARGVGSALLRQLETAAGIVDVPRQEFEHPDNFAARTKLARSITPLPADQVVATLLQFDRAAGFGLREYRSGMLDPFAAVFMKTASNGAVAPDGTDLSRLTAEDLAGRFDEGFVNEFMRDPVVVYSSLPAPVQSVLRELAAKRPDLPAGEAGDPMTRLAPGLSNGIAGN